MKDGSAATGSATSLVDVVAHCQDNLVMDHNEDWWALFKLKNITYELLSGQAKESIFKQIENSISALNQRAKILALVKDFDNESYIKKIKRDNEGNPMWVDWCDRVGDKVHRQSPHEREIFISVRLRKSVGSLEDLAERSLRSAERWFRKMRNRPVTFSFRDQEWALEEARRIKTIFANLLDERDPTPDPGDIQRLIRRGPFRAVGEPHMMRGWEPKFYRESFRDGDVLHDYYAPNIAENRNLLGDVAWEEDLAQMRFYHGDGQISYQRFLKVAKMPSDGFWFPNSEWAFLNMPVDVLLDFDIVPSQKAERERKGKARKLDQQAKHVAEAGADIPYQLKEGHRSNKALESQTAQNKPLVKCHVTLGLAASSKEELELRTQRLRQHYEGLRVELSVPRGNQVEAFTDMLPSGPRRCPDYVQPMAPACLAGSMPIGDSALGDGGPYIGLTRQSESVVGYAPEYPMTKAGGAMSGSAAWVGDLGSGKSVSFSCLMGREALRGHQCLLIDPKGDSRKIRRIPELAPLLREIRIAPGSPTRLPILRIYPFDKLDMTQQLLHSFLAEILNPSNSDERSDAIRYALKEFMTRFENRGGNIRVSELIDCFHAVKKEDDDPGVQAACARLAKLLGIFMDHPLAKLVLSDEAEEGENLADQGTQDLITVIQTDGLQLPKREQVDADDLTEDERISQAIQSVVAAAAFQMASSHRMEDDKPFKMLGFDEAWRLLSNPGGTRLLNYIIREGRSQRVAAFILTQAWKDLENVDVKEHLRIKFIGRNRDEQDIVAALRDMNVDPDPEIVRMVTQFKAGHFVFCDHRGNVGPIRYDVVPKHWLEKLDTSAPDDKKSERGEELVGAR